MNYKVRSSRHSLVIHSFHELFVSSNIVQITDVWADSAKDVPDDALQPMPAPRQKQIFQGLCFYVNGSTAPLVSDHRLKHLLSAHGACHSIVLGRRNVTHVILGAVGLNGGCGGGLAATKLQKEVARTGGKAVRYITVEW